MGGDKKMKKIIIGVVISAVGLWATVSWWWFVVDVIKALFAILLLLIGLTLIGMGLRSIVKERAKATSETG